MFEHVQRSHAIEVLIREWELPAIIKLAVRRNLPCPFDVRFRHVNAEGFVAADLQPPDDLPYPAADVQSASATLLGAQRIGVFGVKLFIPAREEFCIGLVLTIALLVAHASGRPRSGTYGLLLALRNEWHHATKQKPQRQSSQSRVEAV